MENRVEVGIITCDRWEHLSALLSSLIYQTYENWDLTIVDDSLERKDLRYDPCFSGLFKLIEEKGHSWRVLFGPHKGSHFCHQIVLESSRHPLTFRLDDDHLLEPPFLKRLVDPFEDENVGATGGIGLLPKDERRGSLPSDWDERENYTGKVKIKSNGAVGFGNSLQYVVDKNNPYRYKPTQHLVGAMVYRTNVARKWGYNLDLSYVSRCEDDDFSYQFYVNGWKLYVVPDAFYWHFPSSFHGKIKKDSQEYIQMSQEDRVKFEERVRKWNNWKAGMII